MNPSRRKRNITVLLSIFVMNQTITRRHAINNYRSVVLQLESMEEQQNYYQTQSKVNTKIRTKSIPTISQLVGSFDDYECPDGLVIVKDTIDSSSFEKNQRRIPKVIHMTSKTRCMTHAFATNVDSWRFEGHSLFIHDDDAVRRLLNRWWPEFPNIHDIQNCMIPGAAIADLWRYVILWEYGGIYTDIDNAPGPWLWNETGSVITNTTDALFEQERGGFPSQYFFAASSHHPVMYLAVQNALLRVMEVQSIMKQYVPFVTGPGAIKSAVVSTTSLKHGSFCPRQNFVSN